MKANKNKIFSVTFIVFIVAAILVFGGVFFTFNLRNILLGQQKVYILEIAKRASRDFSNYIEREMRTLEAISDIFSDFYSYSSLAEYLEVLEDIKEHYAFEQTGLFFPDTKIAHFDNKETVVNFIPPDVLKKTLEGQSVVSNIIEDPFTKQPAIIYATPFEVNGKIEAILFATQSVEDLYNLLSKYKISGLGFTVVLNKKDQIVLDTEDDLQIQTQDLKKLLSFRGKEGLVLYKNLINVLDTENSGVLSYTAQNPNEHRLISFVKISVLGLEDWHLIFVVPSNVVSVLRRKIFLGSLVFCVALLLSFVFILTMIERREHKQMHEIFKTAFEDKLTGCFNMARFRLETENILRQNPDANFALILLDIDKFKLINDLYGFRQGDLVLNHIANVLEENTDKTRGEIFGRAGGDMFLLLINYEEDKEITARLDKIHQAIENCYAVTDIHYNIRTFFGIYKITDELPFYLMLDRASLAKKTAKENVNKKYVFYDDSSLKNIWQSKEIENNMLKSLKEEEFKLYFQPKCSFGSGNICSAEVLSRWHNKKMGLIPPDRFIPVFEHNGFIIKLDFYVLEKALQSLRTWIDEGLKPYKLSINFSRLHLKDELSLPKIKILLDYYKVPANLIELEITESAVMNNTPEAKKFVDALHDMGISVAMDDFGSGYSSLNVLKDLPFDTLKIDKEFLRDFGKNPRTLAVLEGIIAMLRNMKTCIVAEGVETKEQAAFLDNLKCDLAQGFLYYKPLPSEEFRNLLVKDNFDNEEIKKIL